MLIPSLPLIRGLAHRRPPMFQIGSPGWKDDNLLQEAASLLNRGGQSLLPSQEIVCTFWASKSSRYSAVKVHLQYTSRGSDHGAGASEFAWLLSLSRVAGASILSVRLCSRQRLVEGACASVLRQAGCLRSLKWYERACPWSDQYQAQERAAALPGVRKSEPE